MGNARRGEDGQTIVLVVIGMLALLGMVALVIDIGYAYVGQRELQQSADAAALAGATVLPNASNAVTVAKQYGSGGSNSHTNLPAVNETVSACGAGGSSGCPANALQVVETATPNSFFAKLFGVNTFNIKASALACYDTKTLGAHLISDTATAGPTCATSPTLIPTTITSNFNGTPIPGGDTIWYSAVVKVTGVSPTTTTSFGCSQATVFANLWGTVNIPTASVIFSPTATTATSVYTAATNSWVTTAPLHTSGNVFLTGFELPVPAGGIPGGQNPVNMTCRMWSDTPGTTLNWQWTAAVYKSFTTDYTTVGVKPIDANTGSNYPNSDHAGTPENFKTKVTGGARGGGGSDFTGSYSGTATVNF